MIARHPQDKVQPGERLVQSLKEVLHHIGAREFYAKRAGVGYHVVTRAASGQHIYREDWVRLALTMGVPT